MLMVCRLLLAWRCCCPHCMMHPDLEWPSFPSALASTSLRVVDSCFGESPHCGLVLMSLQPLLNPAMCLMCYGECCTSRSDWPQLFQVADSPYDRCLALYSCNIHVDRGVPSKQKRILWRVNWTVIFLGLSQLSFSDNVTQHCHIGSIVKTAKILVKQHMSWMCWNPDSILYVLFSIVHLQVACPLLLVQHVSNVSYCLLHRCVRICANKQIPGKIQGPALANKHLIGL